MLEFFMMIWPEMPSAEANRSPSPPLASANSASTLCVVADGDR
jgi:hypothetical protein